MQKVSLFNIDLIKPDIKKIVKSLLKLINNHNKCFLVTFNSVMLFHYFIEKKFREILQKARLIIPDSYGVSLIARCFGIRIDNLPGIELLYHILTMANKNRLSVFLLGGKWATINKAYLNLKRAYPDIKFKGRFYGYFKKDIEVIKKIAKSKPDILLVGMGSVKQERWICKNLDSLEAILIIGVGGSFDIISGRKKRAPLWIRKHHFEWLYRSLTSPDHFLNIFKIFFLVLIVLWKYLWEQERTDYRSPI